MKKTARIYFSNLNIKKTNFLYIVEQDKKIDEDKISKVILIGGSTKIPKIREIIEKIFGKDKIIDKFDPKKTVAKGAAIQGAIIRRNSPISYRKDEIYLTVRDNQTIVLFQIYEGENEYIKIEIKDNLFLREFEINGIPKKKPEKYNYI